MIKFLDREIQDNLAFYNVIFKIFNFFFLKNIPSFSSVIIFRVAIIHTSGSKSCPSPKNRSTLAQVSWLLFTAEQGGYENSYGTRYILWHPHMHEETSGFRPERRPFIIYSGCILVYQTMANERRPTSTKKKNF